MEVRHVLSRLSVASEDHADAAAALPPDYGGIRLGGIASEYDEQADDLIVVEASGELLTRTSLRREFIGACANEDDRVGGHALPPGIA